MASAATSWLDDQYNAPDPWGPQPQATPSASSWATQDAEMTPNVTSGGDWSTQPAQASAPAPATQPNTYASDVGPTPQSFDPGQVQQAMGRGVASGSQAAAVGNYQTQIDAVHNAADPQARAVAQDALARQLQQDMEADGHKVTWKGNLMMIDGRPYELAGESVSGGTPHPDTGSATPAGYDATKFNDPTNPSFGDDKYTVGRIISSGGTPEQAAAAIGGTYLGGDWIKDKAGNVFDAVIDFGPNGQNAPQWAKQDFDAQGNWIPPNFGSSGSSSGSWLDGAGGPGGLDLESLFGRAYDRAAAPTSADTAMDSYVMNLLQHPESLSAHDIETLKAQNADQLSAAAQQQDEELQHYGFGAGLDSSPWLAGQRTQNDWNRRTSTIEGNRNIDISAANQRGADIRSAAGVGQAWASLKANEKQAALSHAVSFLSTTLGYDINLKQLSQASEQFKANLMQRIAEFQTQDAQFKATYGLDSQRLQHQIDQDIWDRSHQTYAPA